MTVHQRLVAILAELPAIGKNQKNPQQGFMFRGHDDILNALNPLLAKHGVVVVPDVLERITAQRQTSKGGVMYEVDLHVRFTFYGAEGDSVAASTWGEGTDMGDKATNKAMTMAFKNVLNQTFAISSAEFKDSDAETPEETQGRQAMPAATDKPIQKGTAKMIGEVVESLQKGYPVPIADHSYEQDVKTWIKSEFGKDELAELNEAQAQMTVLEFEKRLIRLQSGGAENVPFGEPDG